MSVDICVYASVGGTASGGAGGESANDEISACKAGIGNEAAAPVTPAAAVACLRGCVGCGAALALEPVAILAIWLASRLGTRRARLAVRRGRRAAASHLVNPGGYGRQGSPEDSEAEDAEDDHEGSLAEVEDLDDQASAKGPCEPEGHEMGWSPGPLDDPFEPPPELRRAALLAMPWAGCVPGGPKAQGEPSRARSWSPRRQGSLGSAELPAPPKGGEACAGPHVLREERHSQGLPPRRQSAWWFGVVPRFRPLGAGGVLGASRPVSKAELEGLFAQFGEIGRIELRPEPIAEDDEDFALVQFKDEAGARDAVAALGGVDLPAGTVAVGSSRSSAHSGQGCPSSMKKSGKRRRARKACAAASAAASAVQVDSKAWEALTLRYYAMRIAMIEEFLDEVEREQDEAERLEKEDVNVLDSWPT